MTLEEAQSEIESLKSGNKALADKNAEILDEMKKERVKNRESDESSQKFYKLQDEYDELKESHTKVERELSKSQKDNEKLLETNTGLNSTNTKLLIDDAIMSKLDSLERFDMPKSQVKREDILQRIKKANPTIVDGLAVFGDKSADDFINEWSGSSEGTDYLSPKESSGGGAGGGSGDISTTTPDRKNMTPDEMMSAGRQ